MVGFNRLTSMVPMVIPFVVFEDVKSGKEADMELVDGLSDDRPHPENKVGGDQVHQSQVRQPTSKGHLQTWIPEVLAYRVLGVRGGRFYITMTAVWRKRRRMARRLFADTSRLVQSGCRSMMKKVTNSENVEVNMTEGREPYQGGSRRGSRVQREPPPVAKMCSRATFDK